MRHVILIGVIIVAVAAAFFMIKSSERPVIIEEVERMGAPAEQETGALVSATMESKVGVLLDEIPQSIRERTAQSLLKQPENFWVERAKNQLRLTTYRLIFRGDFYEEEEGKKQLPLPPEEVWNVQLKGPPRRETADGHDAVIVEYVFTSTLLSDPETPGTSEPILTETGGTWEEPFILPLDPTLLFQRTRFACMDEAEFPPHSVDPEDISTFYDHECEVEEELTNEGCHQTELSSQSCADALAEKTGKIETAIRFERLAWNPSLANSVRIGQITNPTGSDLQAVKDLSSRIVYRYVPSSSCTLVEECIGAPGWRRLLQFPAIDWNTGAKTLAIGQVDYFGEGLDSALAGHNIYEFSECHEHYHFKHYADFSFGESEQLNTKRGFCLQSTARFSNNELSPLNNKYGGCGYQGVESGWGDEYSAGLECQWVDVTNFDTAEKTVTKKLEVKLNPNGFLCEGVPILDEQGNLKFEPSQFKTEDGKPVDKPMCNFIDNYFKNNVHAHDVTLPLDGEGYVTAPCTKGEIGPFRNCGFKLQTKMSECTPGQEVKLSCSTTGAPQVVRICDYSRELGTAIPCTYNGPHNARSLANSVVESEQEITFTCPAMIDEKESGGVYSLYTAPILTEDQQQPVKCTQV